MEKKRKISTIKIFLIFAIPVIFFIYALHTLGNYGINWDEPYHFRRGQAFLQFYLTGKKTYEGMPKYPPLKGGPDSPGFRNSDELFEQVQKDPSLSDPNYRRSYYQDDAWNGDYHIDQENPAGHPALSGILAASFNKIFYQKLGILGDLESYHLFEITIASILVLVVALFMWRQFGVVESVVSSLALASYPLFLGESHFNIKDPIEAAFYTFTLLSFFLAVIKKETDWLFVSIFLFAAALSVKFNVIFVIFPLGLWLLVYRFKNKNALNFSRKFYLLLAISPIIVLSFFVFFFPTLWQNPIWGMEQIVKYYLTVGYSLSQPAKYYVFNFFNTYPLLWIFYATPLVTLFLFLISVFFPKHLGEKNGFGLLLVFAFLTILGRASLFGALTYGGVRIFMEFIPIGAMLCGIAAGVLFRKIGKISLPLFITIILLLYAPTLYKLSKIHPNENVFFNVLAGGLSGAQEKQLSFWGNSNGNAYYPAISWLSANAENNSKLTIPVGSISNIPRFKLRSDISLSADYWSGPQHEGEYVLELTYDYAPMDWYNLKYLNSAMRPVFEVKVDGVAIAKLWKNTPEYLLPEFKNERVIPAAITKEEPAVIKLTLARPEKIMKLEVSQPTNGCSSLTTGYIDTSLDGKNWIREIEDIAREQLKHAKLKSIEPTFIFYFVARKARYIKIHTEDQNSCILQAQDPKVTVLESN